MNSGIMRFGSQNWTSHEEGMRLQKRHFHASCESECNSNTNAVTLLSIKQNYGIEGQTINTELYIHVTVHRNRFVFE